INSAADALPGSAFDDPFDLIFGRLHLVAASVPRRSSTVAIACLTLGQSLTLRPLITASPT
ncbi:hypothetical protein, partial [Bradyrhizobium sp.]|uniref:hypothetical protein n=1 Tax=Bradyrhizobium sp. TaxID=376 RepID=UPI00391B70C0